MGEMGRVPDFWIVGAPKCGTTALHSYLATHPSVFMARKEIHLLAPDLSGLPHEGSFSEEDYLEEFRDARPEELVGETAVWYLYSRRAAREIFSRNPQAKILVLLRNPIDQMHALHRQMRVVGAEPLAEFSVAVEKGGSPPGEGTSDRHGDRPWMLAYREIARFSVQLRRYMEVFGEESVLVLFQEEMWEDTEGTYRRVLRFLGLEEGHRTSFEPLNRSNRPRSFWLARAIRNPPPLLRGLARIVFPQRWRRRAAETVDRLNRKVEPRAPIPGETRRRLLAEMSGELEELSRLLGRDLPGCTR